MLALLRALPAVTLLLVTAISTGSKQLALWLDTHMLLATAEEELPTIAENLRGGSELVLSDGSHYLIAPADRSEARVWITPIPIKITDSGDTTYPLLLTNTLSGVAVKAKKSPTGETP